MSGKHDRDQRAASAAAFRPMQVELSFSTITINQILANPLEGETPTARVKQIAVMMVVARLHGDGLPVTLTRLTEITGLTRSGIAQTIGPLVKRGLLVEEMGKNAMGRGMARQFKMSPTLLQTLDLMMGSPIENGK